MKFTTKGRITLLKDGVQVSQHIVAEEAYEKAFTMGSGKYLVKYPDREIEVKANAPIPVPAPAPTPTPPAPAPTPTPPAAPVIQKITGSPGTPIEGTGGTWGTVVRHQYSKLSAWNVDQSVMFLLNRGGNPAWVFLDGKTFKPLPIIMGAMEMRWHPKDPDLVIYVTGNKIKSYNIKTAKDTELYSFVFPNVFIGPWEGNITDDGQWVVLANGENAAITDIVPFNLITGKHEQALKSAQYGISNTDYATMSPSGRFLIVTGVTNGGNDRTTIFKFPGYEVIATWESHRPSHFDLTYDLNGEEVAVGVSQVGGGTDHPEDGKILSRRLRDGFITKLTPFAYGVHTSARNSLARQKGVVADFAGGAEYGPHSGKIVIIGFDGKFTVVGEHKSINPPPYWGEPQASFSPKGDMVIFASNGGSGSNVGAYVATGV